MSKPGLATRIAATLLLTRIIDDGRNLDGLLDTRHGPRQFSELSQADKALARAIVTVALRRRGEIDFALNKLLDRKLPAKARQLHHTLHVARRLARRAYHLSPSGRERSGQERRSSRRP